MRWRYTRSLADSCRNGTDRPDRSNCRTYLVLTRTFDTTMIDPSSSMIGAVTPPGCGLSDVRQPTRPCVDLTESAHWKRPPADKAARRDSDKRVMSDLSFSGEYPSIWMNGHVTHVSQKGTDRRELPGRVAGASVDASNRIGRINPRRGVVILRKNHDETAIVVRGDLLRRTVQGKVK